MTEPTISGTTVYCADVCTTSANTCAGSDSTNLFKIRHFIPSGMTFAPSKLTVRVWAAVSSTSQGCRYGIRYGTDSGGTITDSGWLDSQTIDVGGDYSVKSVLDQGSVTFSSTVASTTNGWWAVGVADSDGAGADTCPNTVTGIEVNVFYSIY